MDTKFNIKKDHLFCAIVVGIFLIAVFTKSASAQTTFDCSTVNENPQLECEALVAFYNSTDGDNWTDNTGWLQTNTPCNTPWFGVTCDQGHVTKLDLHGNQLYGSIPPAIGDLVNLQWLSLYLNQLWGSIPPELGNLSNLTALSLDGNQLSGTIPPELGSLQNLYSLYLNENPALSGPLPSTLMNLALGNFHFSETALCEPGEVDFQNWLSGISNLGRTDVTCSSTDFVCSNITEIPQAECEVLVKLYHNMDGDSWTENIGWLETYTPCTTPWFGVTCNLDHVIKLDLPNNHLFGYLPPELGELSNLEILNLSTNYGIMGMISPELGNLASLTDLWLDGNLLSGNIPPALGSLTNLKSLYLNNNSNLSGPLPSTLMDLPLGTFNFSSTALCEPGDVDFQNWLSSISNLNHTDVICSLTNFTCSNVTEIPKRECETLISFYYSTDGPNWTENSGWLLTDTPCTTPWYGLTCDSGKVLGLSLNANQLSGFIPPELSVLSGLNSLFLFDNSTLSGRLPTTLTSVALEDFSFSGTALCEPEDVDFQDWLADISNLQSTNISCTSEEFPCVFVNEVPRNECDALVALYKSTNGNQWEDNSGWLLTNTPCTTPWYGVSCDSGNVQALNLANNKLWGNIPSALGDLSGLQHLELYLNQLEGSIPPELGNLSNLTALSLDGNQLSGTIPPELGSLQNLYSLYLNENPALSGPLPSTLKNLALGNFHFSETALCEPGEVDFQNWLSGISNLGRTDVTCSSTDFVCSNVTEIPQAECEALVALYNSTDGGNWTNNDNWLLTDNPCTWYGIQCYQSGHITHISLDGNNLTGSIPSQLEDLPSLDFLALSYNKLDGSIPPHLGNLINLTYLGLSDNYLSESIPPQLGNLSSLEWLVLSENQLTGNIPADLSKLTKLKFMYLNENQLDGSIPPQFGNLTNLRSLILSNNQLTEGIPSDLAKPANLQDLVLRNNKLSGNIPPELGDLSSLDRLLLDNNPRLIGPLPSVLTKLTLTKFHFSETGLCEPGDTNFRDWLNSITDLNGTGVPCTAADYTYIVTSIDDNGDNYPGDGLCDDGNGACTFRAALEEVNVSNISSITFNIPGAGPHSILPYSPLPEITAPLIIDGYTQPGAAQATETSPAVIQIELVGTNAGPESNGLVIKAPDVTIRGLVINRFDGSGVLIEGTAATNNRIQGNFIGTDGTGMVDMGNSGNGITVWSGASNNLIGGSDPGDGNVISGNQDGGIGISGIGTTQNVVQGNLIGTDLTGTQPLGNTFTGIFISSGPTNNQILGNIVSNNGSSGVVLDGLDVTGNLVAGNFIGTDIHGSSAMPNATAGVWIVNGAHNNLIGGTTTEARNLISGNDGSGVSIVIEEPGFYQPYENAIQGNYIGTDVSGILPLGNTEAGVFIADSINNLVGGDFSGARNVISGNDGSGVVILGSGATGNIVQGNFIGTDETGMSGLANGTAGVIVYEASDNTIGGFAASSGNVISGNAYGVAIVASTQVEVIDNLIGFLADGTDVLPNIETDMFVDTSTAIRVQADVPIEGYPLIIDACGAGAIHLDDDESVVIDCGSISVNVILGPVEIIFNSSEWVTAMATLGTGYSLTFDPETLSFFAPETNKLAIMLLLDGKEIKLEPDASVVIPSVTITEVAAPVDPTPVNTEITVSAAFTDVDESDAHTAIILWGDGSSSDVEINEDDGTLVAPHIYNQVGVYTLELRIMDEDRDFYSSITSYIVVYDPEGGFVTGGGWIDSPVGAYFADPSLEGKATFGFVSKYKKGAETPTGSTEFQFKVVGLTFHSLNYEWLVVNQNGTNAQFKGTGTINGTGEYKFMLWASDGEPDSFRIKIWEEDESGNETVVYDNGLEGSGFENGQPINGGSIVVHTK